MGFDGFKVLVGSSSAVDGPNPFQGTVSWWFGLVGFEPLSFVDGKWETPPQSPNKPKRIGWVSI